MSQTKNRIKELGYTFDQTGLVHTFLINFAFTAEVLEFFNVNTIQELDDLYKKRMFINETQNEIGEKVTHKILSITVSIDEDDELVSFFILHMHTVVNENHDHTVREAIYFIKDYTVLNPVDYENAVVRHLCTLPSYQIPHAHIVAMTNNFMVPQHCLFITEMILFDIIHVIDIQFLKLCVHLVDKLDHRRAALISPAPLSKKKGE